MAHVNKKRILFLSFKTLLDRNSGAALELKTVLESFANDAHDVAAISFNCYDNGVEYALDPRIAAELSDTDNIGQLFHFDENGIRHYLQVAPSMDTMGITQSDFDLFVQNAKNIIHDFAPTTVVFFGSNELIPLLEAAREIGSRLVLYAGTAAYGAERQPLFDLADEIVVPTDFMKDLYKERFQVTPTTILTALPFALPEIDVALKTSQRHRSFITIINPAADKGGHVAFAIAKKMPLNSNDFLAVESRATNRFWQDHGYNTASIPNLFWAPWQPDIRRILEKTSILLMPSLISEAAGKVMSEAMAFGVPTIAYDVGGIKQQLSGSGTLLHLRDSLKLNPSTMSYDIYPSDDEIEPWIKAIYQLLDSEEFYREKVVSAIAAAGQYELSNVMVLWSDALH